MNIGLQTKAKAENQGRFSAFFLTKKI